jgi:protein-tyrosine kinase
MSIIERVAQLLEPIAQGQGRPSVSYQTQRDGNVALIERAMEEERERSTSPIIDHAAASSGASAAIERIAATSSAVSGDGTARIARTVDIDIAMLRQKGIVTPGGERTQAAESFRRIKRRVLTNAANPKGNAPANLVLVTSALPGEGKTFCAINLAISIALEVDHSVMLVDADVRKPSIPDVLGFTADKGLMDVLVDGRIDFAEVLCRTKIGRLTILPAGTAHKQATELLASGAMRELLAEMATRYRDRIIIFDSPPLLLASEAGVLASQMGQVVVVVESGKTTESAVKEALGHIDSNHLTGLVLNKTAAPGLGSYHGAYGHGA